MASAMPDLWLPLLSHTVSPPIDWYQIILLGDKDTTVWTACPSCYTAMSKLGVKPVTMTSWLQVW